MTLLELHCYLHFVYNKENHPVYDRLWKIWREIDLFGEWLRSVFVPNQNISIDESLWKFHGRLCFSTYNPNKQARFGVKVYKLLASDGPCAGYTSVYDLYW